MVKDKRIIQVEQWLKLIDRTRLFCNTTSELEKLVGFSVSNRNSLSRKGGNSLFMKEAIFHQLCYICQEQTGMDLQAIVEAYEDVDNFIDRYASSLHDDKVLPLIVDMFYGSGSVPDGLAFVKKRLDEHHIPILLLMLTKRLPRLSAKNGDVQNIEEDYMHTFMLFRESCKNVPMQELPAISMMESEVKTHPDKRNRLHLIHATSFILNAYGAISTQQRISLTNREMLWSRYEPDVDGIWTEDDSFTAFWCFEEVNNGYYLYHYKLRNEQRELAYTKYFISFHQYDDGIEAVVVHPRSIRYIINGQPVPNLLFSYQNCELADDEISLLPQNDQHDWFRLTHLIRSSHAKYFQALLSDDTKEKINECSDADYDFSCCLAALTADHIFLRHPDGSSYYKIPKALNDVLYDIQFGDNVGILSFEGSIYAAFDDKNLYYDITTEEKMRELGIEVVEEDF